MRTGGSRGRVIDKIQDMDDDIVGTVKLGIVGHAPKSILTRNREGNRGVAAGGPGGGIGGKVGEVQHCESGRGGPIELKPVEPQVGTRQGIVHGDGRESHLVGQEHGAITPGMRRGRQVEFTEWADGDFEVVLDRELGVVGGESEPIGTRFGERGSGDGFSGIGNQDGSRRVGCRPSGGQRALDGQTIIADGALECRDRRSEHGDRGREKHRLARAIVERGDHAMDTRGIKVLEGQGYRRGGGTFLELVDPGGVGASDRPCDGEESTTRMPQFDGQWHPCAILGGNRNADRIRAADAEPFFMTPFGDQARGLAVGKGEVAAHIKAARARGEGGDMAAETTFERVPFGAVPSCETVHEARPGVGEIAAGVEVGAVPFQGLDNVIEPIADRPPATAVPTGDVGGAEIAGVGEIPADVEIAVWIEGEGFDGGGTTDAAAAGERDVADGCPGNAVPSGEIGGEAGRGVGHESPADIKIAIGSQGEGVDHAILDRVALGGISKVADSFAQPFPILAVPFGDVERDGSGGDIRSLEFELAGEIDGVGCGEKGPR